MGVFVYFFSDFAFKKSSLFFFIYLFISIYFNSVLVGTRIDPQGIKVRYLPGYPQANCMDIQSDISRSVELSISSSVVHKEKQMFRQKRKRNVWLY